MNFSIAWSCRRQTNMKLHAFFMMSTLLSFSSLLLQVSRKNGGLTAATSEALKHSSKDLRHHP
jgi:hypothetical protein